VATLRLLKEVELTEGLAVGAMYEAAKGLGMEKAMEEGCKSFQLSFIRHR